MNKNSLIGFYTILLLFITTFSAFSQTAKKLSAEQWEQDISYYLNNMEKVHINPYHTTSKSEFEKFAVDLSGRVSSMSDNQALVEILRITAMIGDGHTGANIFGWHGDCSECIFNFHVYPLRFYVFSDGVYTLGGAPQYNELVGKKITKIGGKDIKEILIKIEPVVIRDNEYSLKFNIPYYLCNAEILNGLGITDNTGEAEFTAVDMNGKESSVKVSSVEMSKLQHHSPGSNNRLPLYMCNDEKNYWYEYLAGSKTLYINYKRVLIDQADSLTKFCKRIEEFVNGNEIERTIIDIRNNGGGNNTTCQPFVNLISKNPKLNQKGKLFVIIGRQTFSAASYLATKLEFNTKAIFVGEPTGAVPNHYGDNRPLILPNSKLEIRLSSIYWQNSFPVDKRTATEPEVKVEMSANDYFAGKDPLLEAALNFKLPETQIKGYDKSIIGSYLYSPLQTLEIKEDDMNLNMVVMQTDILGRNVSFIYTSLYPITKSSFNTDINSLGVTSNNGSLKINYMGNEWEIKKAPGDFKTLEQLLDAGKYTEAVKMISDAKEKDPNYTGVSESVINTLGYYALGKKNFDGAIAIFQLNVELYPNSFNTYDSLGEAYMLAGNKELAIENYKKSIELNPNNNSGKKMLEKLTR